MLQPIFAKQERHGPAQKSSNENKNGENVSRIIPIKVETGAGAFNQPKKVDPTESSSSLNTLEELQHHQSATKAEESIRGYSKPKVNNSNAPSRGSGFDDVMRSMKANPTFAQREMDSSV